MQDIGFFVSTKAYYVGDALYRWLEVFCFTSERRYSASVVCRIKDFQHCAFCLSEDTLRLWCAGLKT
jgi:hypothetical protein